MVCSSARSAITERRSSAPTRARRSFGRATKCSSSRLPERTAFLEERPGALERNDEHALAHRERVPDVAGCGSELFRAAARGDLGKQPPCHGDVVQVAENVLERRE